jgi:hypothetical protein
MTPEIAAALDEIRAAYEGCRIDAVEDSLGGALVTVQEIGLEGGLYLQARTFVGFHITHTYPYADIYPIFVRHDLGRRDGKALGEGMSIGVFRNQPAVQISRRANKLDPGTDTALLKLQKVLRWLTSRP